MRTQDPLQRDSRAHKIRHSEIDVHPGEICVQSCHGMVLVKSKCHEAQIVNEGTVYSC